MNFSFPRTIFVDQNGLMQQLEHMASEQTEVEQSALTPDLMHTAEELMDKYHSCETGLRILAEKYNIDLDSVIEGIIKKNADRGYYGQQMAETEE